MQHSKIPKESAELGWDPSPFVAPTALGAFIEGFLSCFTWADTLYDRCLAFGVCSRALLFSDGENISKYSRFISLLTNKTM